MLIIGNGPSTKILKDYGFKNIPENYDTFAMNSFYRYAKEIDWWPTYYAAFDTTVTPYHRQNFKEMMENHSEIKKFFSYSGSFVDIPRYQSKKPNLKSLTTGSAAAWISILMGYKKIILIGIDCNYIDYIDECEKYRNDLRIKENPKENPNYFFNEYQIKGDQYRIPNKFVHHNSWKEIKEIAYNKGVEIINISDISEISFFSKSTIEKEFK